MVHLSAQQIFQTFRVAPQPAADLMARLRPDSPADWRALATALALKLERADRLPRVLGISGGQGSGKSTLSHLLGQALQLLDVRVLVLSLDDFYLTRMQRGQLARREHPLLATRGVPGTHDMVLLRETLAAVFTQGRQALPVFDKGRDDRAPDPVWFDGPADLVVLEGWCVGATPEPEIRLVEPLNALERDEDPQGRWRGYVNESLSLHYQNVWRQLDSLLYLVVPDIAAVRRWRGEQELERPAAQRMTPEQIARFVAHYERLTLWMRDTLTTTADIVGFLDADHRLEALRRLE